MADFKMVQNTLLHVGEKPEPETPPPEYAEIDQVKSPAPPCADEVAVFLVDLPLEKESPPEYTELDLPEKEGGDIDPWEAPELQETGEKWIDLDLCGKIRRVLVAWIGKLAALLCLLYLFICSLDFLSSAFRLLGGKTAGQAFSSNVFVQNPVAGLMLGILATVLVQSSSTSTSIVVTMVASGIMSVRPAIPIIMGANIGTSVTNTIVSMAQSGNRNEFRRAFGGATVHDMFNWLAVLVLLPLESVTGYLYHLTNLIVKSYQLNQGHGTKQDLLKTITKPFTHLIVQLDKKVIEKIATGNLEFTSHSLIKEWCEYKKVTAEKNVTSEVNVTLGIGSQSKFLLINKTELKNITESVPVKPCSFLFHNTGLNDTVIGIILLGISLFILCTCLVLMVKLLHSMLRGRIASIIKKTVNADFPGKLSFLTGYVAIFIGAGMTILVQSSSVFTSAMTPLVGIGVIRLERMYPLTLGSNIGTTATGLLAAMAASGDKLEAALQIALCHLFFNISGILLFYPVPRMRVPIQLAKMMGNTTADYRWFAVFYMVLMFFILPGIVFALSMWGIIPLFVVLGIFMISVAAVITINLIQRKRPQVLPPKLRNWEFLPECLHSLDPLDRVIRKVTGFFTICCPSCCKAKKPNKRQHGDHELPEDLTIGIASESILIRKTTVL